ncbi:hypothetical protein [Sinorhizobium medicae]|uniref:hypothetical protein n=1 Tax=Sinorhizobium medicae TaxID=110321 RepID=UPI000C7AA63B|nr:hypothetical protein [Sinorhizobium medicae]PLU25734.1 hypothetical protein BMJ28_33520 [Sinorhizobium medicae]
MKNQPKERERQAGKQPTHVVKMLKTEGDRSTFDRIGVAWERDDGSLYVKLHGTQIVAEGFTLYPMDDAAR